MATALSFGNDVHASGQRRHRRARLSLPAVLETITSRQPGQMTSLSRSGACVRVLEVPRLGSDVLLRSGDVDAFGTVVWSGLDACGIRFEELLPDQLVVAVRLLSDRQHEIVSAQRVAAARAWSQGAAR